MARSAHDDGQILSKLQRMNKLVVPLTGAVSTTLDADAAVDATELAFLRTGFTANSWVLVDTGLNQSAYKLGTVPGDTAPIPLLRPTDFAHLEGAPVKKLNVLDMGYIEEGGATLSGSSTQSSVGAANANGKIWIGEPEMGDMAISWGQRAASPENILAMYGVPEDLLKGDGTAGNPYRAMVHPDVIGTQRDWAVLGVGRLKNLQTAYALFLNPTPTVAVNAVFGAKNNPMVCTVGLQYTHWLWWVE